MKHRLSPILFTFVLIIIIFYSYFFLYLLVWNTTKTQFDFYLNLGCVLTLSFFFLLGITIGLSFRNYLLTQIKEFLIFGSILSLLLIIGLGNVFLTIILMDIQIKTFYPDIQYTLIDLFQFCTPDVIFPFFLLRSSDLRVLGGLSLLWKNHYVPRSWGNFNIHEYPIIGLVTLLWDYFNVISNFIILFIFSLYFARAIWYSTPRRVKITLFSLTGLNLLFILVCFILELTDLIDNVILYNRIPMTEYYSYMGLVFHFPMDLPLLSLIPLVYDLIIFPSVVFFSCFYLGAKMYRVIDPPNPTPPIIRSSFFWKSAILFLMSFEFMNVVVNFPFVLMDWLQGQPVYGFGRTLPPYDFIFFFLLFLSIIIIWYPEGLLIFETHLYLAKKRINN